MYGQVFAGRREGLLLYKLLWIINKLKQKATDEILSATKFIWTCLANQAGENSSSIFTVSVRSVPRYYFKLAYVILQIADKEFFETHL